MPSLLLPTSFFAVLLGGALACQGRQAPPQASGGAREQRAAPSPDCARLVSADEVAAACGRGQAPMTVQTMEGLGPKATCARSFELGGAKHLSFVLADELNREAAAALPWHAAHEPLAIGDGAASYIKGQGDQFDWHTIEVRSGRHVIYLRAIAAAGAPNPCDEAALEELAARVPERL